MKTLLVIAPSNGLAAAVRASLDSSRYRVLEHEDLREDELRLTGASMDVCVFDADLTTVAPIRQIERLHRVLPLCPVVLFASESHWSWEEEAYLLGVRHVLSKPVRGKLLNTLLDRMFAAPSAPAERPALAAPPTVRVEERRYAESPVVPARMLQLLRNSSSILCHSLSTESLVKEFLLVLREILGLNRAAIFLKAPPHESRSAEGAQRLKPACALGISNSVLSHFELSLDAGIGGYAMRSGRVLRRHSAEAEADARMAREFDTLGARVAIPVLDRESLLGVAMLDERMTGEAMTSDELALIFHLLEQLGVAIKNIWRHDEVSARHNMMSDVLRHIKAGCIVVGPELNVLHANDTARGLFPRPGRSGDAFDFNDLPQIIGGKIFTVLKTGQPVVDYKYHSTSSLGQRFLVSITPFRKDHSALPTSALVVVEDCTAADRLRQLEVETANLRLVQQMAERLAHEIGNAVVPISTHQQLLADRISDPDFQVSLAEAMEEGVKRVSRLVDQMRFLARERMGRVETIPVRQLIEEAFREARGYHPSTTVYLEYESENAGESLSVTCDRQGLQHAFAEIILNAMQASNAAGQVHVRTRTETDTSGSRWARIEVQDSGAGFTAEAAGKASEPFFTTRKVGLGLGLAVTSKIIQTHAGKLEIPPPRSGVPGMVRISLPLEQVPGEGPK